MRAAATSLVSLALWGWTLAPWTSLAQTLPVRGTRTYQLLEGSVFINDCPVCGRPTIPIRMRGSFELVWVEENPLFSTYELTNISFEAQQDVAEVYRVTGRGTYRQGGEVALQQELTLDVTVNTGSEDEPVKFTNEIKEVERTWPMMSISLDEVTESSTRVYRMQLLAAPIQDLWFSTVNGMTSGNREPPANHISRADLLSAQGHVVRSQEELLGKLGFMPGTVGSIGIDALEVLPGEVRFSLDEDAFSETLGQLQHGDLLSDRGRVIRKNQSLMTKFGLMPPVPDVGLDAVHVLDSGEVLFSITTDVFSETIGSMLQHGDLLSDRGSVFRSNRDLLSRFHPREADRDYGLDALSVWPSGEVWFSTSEGFADDGLGGIMAGDLLSDQGYVVFRNLELTGGFQPLEDLADFGLDGLFVVTETATPASRPLLRELTVDPLNGDVTVSWEGQGRAYRLERADEVKGLFVPVGPIGLSARWTDPGAANSRGAAFYRLRQW